MKEAIKFHLEGLKKEYLPIPESSTRAVSIWNSGKSINFIGSSLVIVKYPLMIE